MKKFLLFLVFSLLFLFLLPKTASAAIKFTQDPNPAYVNSDHVTFTFTSDAPETNFNPNSDYSFAGWSPGQNTSHVTEASWDGPPVKPASEQVLVLSMPINGLTSTNKAGTWIFKLWLGRGAQDLNNNSQISSGTFIINPPGVVNTQTGKQTGLPAIRVDTTIFKADTTPNVYIVNAQPDQNYTIWFNNDKSYLFSGKFTANQIAPKGKYNDDENVATAQLNNIGKPSDSLKTLCMTPSDAKLGTLFLSCDFRITGINIVAQLPKSLPDSVISNKVGVPSENEPPFVPGPCQPEPGKEKDGVVCKTAFGDINTNPTGFIKSLFGIILSLAGGVAIILIMISGYRLMSSQGNPEKVQAAREQLTSAIVGLLFIIFSVTILQIIGVDILHIPGFTSQ